jgi:hypothetical protein
LQGKLFFVVEDIGLDFRNRYLLYQEGNQIVEFILIGHGGLIQIGGKDLERKGRAGYQTTRLRFSSRARSPLRQSRSIVIAN